MVLVTAKTLGKAAVLRFARREDGTLALFAMILFTLMIMMGGMAVDLMRYEQTRTTLQHTLDRSTLAAASLSQDLNAIDVVNDYFEKAGLLQYLTNVQVDEGINFKEVTADARADTDPYFLHMLGIDTFEAPGHSMAEQRVTNVEIALVLDVSGSMSGTKLTNLKTAAKEFVQTVLTSDSENRISITIVPYNAQVNLGPTLRAKYNAQHLHGVNNVNCLEIPASMYSVTGISRTTPLSMTAYADMDSYTDKVTEYVDQASTSRARMSTAEPYCIASDKNIIRLPSNNVTTLQSQINGLTAGGNTSIMLGMKWGVALLDPDARDMMSEFVTAGAIRTEFDGRPFDWDDNNSMKLIVLMTDGEHVSHTYVPDAYKSGASPIYRAADGNYSIYHASVTTTNKYWVPHRSAWQATPWTNTSTAAVQQDWKNIWPVMRQSWVAWQLYARALGTSSTSRNSIYSTWMNNFADAYVQPTSMNSQLQEICTLAKSKAVVVYGIAFEAPTNGQTQIKSCASSAAHYFNAKGLQIQSAFRAIANNISQLRLTQ
jgi:Flp pilus assembly protein TadG